MDQLNCEELHKEFLEAFGETVATTLKDAEIDGKSFVTLTRDDLLELLPGPKNFMVRKKIMGMMENVSETGTQVTSPFNTVRKISQTGDASSLHGTTKSDPKFESTKVTKIKLTQSTDMAVKTLEGIGPAGSFPIYFSEGLTNATVSALDRRELIRITMSNMRTTTHNLDLSREPAVIEIENMARALVKRYSGLADDASLNPAKPWKGLFTQLKKRLSNLKPTEKPQGHMPSRGKKKESIPPKLSSTPYKTLDEHKSYNPVKTSETSNMSQSKPAVRSKQANHPSQIVFNNSDLFDSDGDVILKVQKSKSALKADSKKSHLLSNESDDSSVEEPPKERNYSLSRMYDGFNQNMKKSKTPSQLKMTELASSSSEESSHSESIISRKYNRSNLLSRKSKTSPQSQENKDDILSGSSDEAMFHETPKKRRRSHSREYTSSDRLTKKSRASLHFESNNTKMTPMSRHLTFEKDLDRNETERSTMEDSPRKSRKTSHSFEKSNKSTGKFKSLKKIDNKVKQGADENLGKEVPSSAIDKDSMGYNPNHMAKHYQKLITLLKSKSPNKKAVNHLMNLEYPARHASLTIESKEDIAVKVCRIASAYPCFASPGQTSELLEELRRIVDSDNANYTAECRARMREFIKKAYVHGVMEGKIQRAETQQRDAKAKTVCLHLNDIFPSTKKPKPSMIQELIAKKSLDKAVKSTTFPTMLIDSGHVIVAAGGKMIIQESRRDKDCWDIGLLYLLATYYTYNMSYQPGCEISLLLIQEIVAKDTIHPDDCSNKFKTIRRKFQQMDIPL